MKRHIVFLFFLLFGHFLFSQVPNQNISSGSLDINGQTYNGFKTNIDFSSKSVDRGFWSYCRSFAKVLNQRTYQEITIPGTNTDKLVLYSQSTTRSKNHATFTIVLKDDGMDDNLKKKYLSQVKALLADFRRQLFLDHYDEKVEKLEKKAETLARKYAKSNEEQKQALYAEMKIIELEITSLRQSQAQIAN